MTIPTCHPDRPHKAKGLCKACWARTRTGATAAPLPVPVVTTSTEDTAAPVRAPSRNAGRSGLLCPVDPAHGPLLASKDPARGWFCPHAAHDGRLSNHPDGPAPRTPHTFTTAQAEAGTIA